MITKTNSTLTNLKNLFIEIFLDKTKKVNNVADGSILNATAFGVAKIAQKAMKDVAIKEAQIFPETATGEYLDKAAALYGVSPRKGALGSSTYVRVYAEPGTIYDENIFFVNKNGIRFSVDEPLTIDNQGYGYVKVRSTNAGYATNVPPNSITNLSPQPQGHIDCTNEYYAIGGRDSEDDETFRIRIKNNLNVLSKGTIEYYTQIFQNIDDRVLKVISVGLDEQGIFNIYIVAQNGIFFTEDELNTMLEKSQDYFGLFELNLEGSVVGIALKNAEWFYIGSDRGMDFRLQINPDYDVATVRKNIQVNLTKYLDFRFWVPGNTVQWDDLLDIVKKTEGVKYVPDQYFFPYYDEQVPINQLPRVKGFVMRDIDGNILYDSESVLSPTFYPAESEDLFEGLSDNYLSLTQLVYFIITDDNGQAVSGARISVGNNVIITDDNGQAVLSLPNGSYNYVISKTYYETISDSFIVLNSSVSISKSLTSAPWNVTFVVKDEKNASVYNAIITVGEKQVSTDTNGKATLPLKNGTYPYTITKLGYDTVSGKSFTIKDANITVSNVLYFHAWNIAVIVLDDTNSNPIQNATITINQNNYLTDETGKAIIPLVNGQYNVTITKSGYNDLQKSITVNNSDLTQTYRMTLFEYNVNISLTQEDGLTVISGATITIASVGVSVTTDVNGKASFTLVNGDYSYLITKQEFDNLSGTFNVLNENLDLKLKMVFRHFDVVLTVLDQNDDAISEATVTLNGESLTTDTSGVVRASLQNGTYPYTITKLGYIDYSGNIIVADQNVSTVAKLQNKKWNILFTVKGRNDVLIQGATIQIFGSQYTTNENGQVTVQLINGTYPYTISYTGYDDYQNTLLVFNQDDTVNVNIDETLYNVTFNVTDSKGIAVSGASINVNSQILTTNNGGIANIDLANGTYPYTITKSGYISLDSQFTVDGIELIIPAKLTSLSYTVTFTVKDNNTPSNLIQGVSIDINEQTLTTNAEGVATIDLIAGTYPVTYTKQDYVTETSSIVVTGAMPVEQILKKIWKLSFLVKDDENQPINGASVKVSGNSIIGGEQTKTTKADGTTDNINTINGNYSFSASKTGYSPIDGQGTILNNDKVENLELVFGFATTFVVKDSSSQPINGATILIDNIDTITTGTDGTAVINLSTGNHNYVITKDGFVANSGSVTVNEAEQTVNISMVNGGTVTFIVESNNVAQENITITVNNAVTRITLPTSGTTNAQGQWSVELPNGNYKYTAAGSGFKTTEEIPFTVSSNPLPIATDLTDYQYYTITINTTVNTTNLNGVNVKLLQSDETLIEQKTTAEGKCVFTNVNGSYKVEAALTNYYTETSNIDITVNNANTESTFVFQQYAPTVTFTVKDEGNQNPISDILVRLRNSTGILYEGTTNAEGVATIVGTKPGTPSSGVIYGDYLFLASPTSPDSPYKQVEGEVTINSPAINKEVFLNTSFDVTFTVKAKSEVELIHTPQIGDYVYSDGTWNKAVISGKSIVGVVISIIGNKAKVMLGDKFISPSSSWGPNFSVPDCSSFSGIDWLGTDINGKKNTDACLAAGADQYSYMYRVNTFSIGVFTAGKWYIPSSGEFIRYSGNLTHINNILTAGGKTPPNNSYYICSTQYSGTQYWRWYLNGKKWEAGDKSSTMSGYNTIPFTQLNFNPTLPAEGVYIFSVGKKFYTSDQWQALTTKPTPVGVAVITEDTSFIVSIKDTARMNWSNSNDLNSLSNFSTTSVEEASTSFFGGMDDTYYMINNLNSSTSSIAETANNFKFPNGQRGYVPSLGELKIIFDNRMDINNCLIAIGEHDALFPNNIKTYWTSSTVYSSNQTAWSVRMNNSVFYTSGISKSNTNNYLRALTYIPMLDSDDGLFIQDYDYNLHAEEDWTSGNAIGVAFIRPDVSFVIDKNPSSGHNQSWSTTTSLVNNIVTVDSTAIAITDYEGESNTDQIISQLGSEAGAANYCRNLSFGLNGVKGYLPALGELNEVWQNLTSINKLLTKIGSTIENASAWLWASTQYNATHAWNLFIYQNNVTYQSKTVSSQLRPFFKVVKISEKVLQGARVESGVESDLTNQQGIAVLSLEGNKDHNYTVSADNYLTKSGQTGILTSTKSIEETLIPAFPVTLRVVANTSSSSTTVDNASIHITSLTDSSTDFTVLTNSVGSFLTYLPLGTYNAEITKSGYQSTNSNFSITSENPGTINFVLKGIYSMTIQTKRVGVGIQTIVTAKQGETVVKSITTDIDGNGVLSDLVYGDYILNVVGTEINQNYIQPYNQSFQITQNYQNLVNLTPLYDVKIQTNFSGVNVTLKPPTGSNLTGTTGSDNSYTFNQVRSGTGVVTLTKTDYQTINENISIVQNTSFSQTFNFTMSQMPKLVLLDGCSDGGSLHEFHIETKYPYVSLLMVAPGGIFTGVTNTEGIGGCGGMVAFKKNIPMDWFRYSGAGYTVFSFQSIFKKDEFTVSDAARGVSLVFHYPNNYMYINIYTPYTNCITQSTSLFKKLIEIRFGANRVENPDYVASEWFDGYGFSFGGAGNAGGGGTNGNTSTKEGGLGGDGPLGKSGGSLSIASFTKGTVIPISSIFGGNGAGMPYLDSTSDPNTYKNCNGGGGAYGTPPTTLDQYKNEPLDYGVGEPGNSLTTSPGAVQKSGDLLIGLYYHWTQI